MGILLVIVPTGLIGALAVQRFSVLTSATAELSTRDLPELVTVDHLRNLLFQQADLERKGELTPGAFTSARRSLSAERAKLLAYEPPDPANVVPNDTALVRRLNDAIVRCVNLDQRIAQLLFSGRVAEAHALNQRQLAPALQTALADAASLRVKEEREAAAASALVQQQSQMATQLVLTLTVLAVLLSILLAVVLTRSLTRPLAALLRATAALAAGDLTASPEVESGDEIGQVADAFDVMRSNLSATIAALERERRQTQAIIDASHDGVMLVDGQHKVVQLNPAAERLSGWPAADAIAQHWWTVFGARADLALELSAADGTDPAGPPLPRHGREERAAGSPRAGSVGPDVPAKKLVIQSELLVHPRNGPERWLAVSSAPVAWNGDSLDRRTVLNFHDISDLKAIDRLKSDFVAMVSHELRAPLTTVTGAVEMLATVDPSDESGSYREVVGILEQQTRRLRSVVDEVLQVTRLEARQMLVHLEPVALTEFLQGLVETVHVEWGNDGRPLSVQATDRESPVWADRSMLEIVIRNLLDNARKYTPRGSAIGIEVLAGTTAGQLQVRVTDHGPGIPQDQIEHVFDRFSRGAQSSYNWTRGYGLGLYFARELIRAHDGEIWVENRADGASFILSLRTVAPDDVDDAAGQRGAV